MTTAVRVTRMAQYEGFCALASVPKRHEALARHFMHVFNPFGLAAGTAQPLLGVNIVRYLLRLRAERKRQWRTLALCNNMLEDVAKMEQK